MPRKVPRGGQERYPSHSKDQNHLPGRLKQSFSKPDQTTLYCVVGGGREEKGRQEGSMPI